MAKEVYYVYQNIKCQITLDCPNPASYKCHVKPRCCSSPGCGKNLCKDCHYKSICILAEKYSKPTVCKNCGPAMAKKG